MCAWWKGGGGRKKMIWKTFRCVGLCYKIMLQIVKLKVVGLLFICIGLLYKTMFQVLSKCKRVKIHSVLGVKVISLNKSEIHSKIRVEFTLFGVKFSLFLKEWSL